MLLPAGTTKEQVEAVKVFTVPVGKPVPSYRIAVRRIHRTFFLGANFQPEPSFIEWSGAVTLTDGHREEIVWTAK
ncbi:hypothetical protein ACFQI7_23460 [Paenibacillus allorhizosphaerae]|uniref:hypothetical protein n=1 Tax=Paenibacillus allorhizosphaerae TaxID=2849866 RepID=UPI001C4047C8|nr:hypothetical protein [Paenibacillus allorhizosphaerae]